MPGMRLMLRPHSSRTAPLFCTTAALQRRRLLSQLPRRLRQRLQLSATNSQPSSPLSEQQADKTDDVPNELACYGVGTEVECVINPEYDHDIPTATTATQQAQEGPTLLETLVLISPFFFWGTSMVAMKQLAPHTTPLFVASFRLLPAGVALLAWAGASGRKGPNTAIGWVAIALFGLVDGAMFQGFLAEGLQRTSAGLGSVIIDSQPLTVAALAALLFGETLGAWGVLGLGLGVAGLCLLEVPPAMLAFLPEMIANGGLSSISLGSSGSGDAPWSIWDSGEWWMLLAAQSMAVGTVMVRWVAKHCDPVMATGWHMILGGIPLAALAWTQDGGELADRMSQINAYDVGLLAYVSLLGSAASYGVFFYEATVRGNLTALSSLTFLTPMFAAAGGYAVLGETLTPLQLGGAAVTLVAVGLISSGAGKKADGETPLKSE